MPERDATTAGAPETPAPTGPSLPESPAAFLSYSHLDRDFAVRLRDALDASGHPAWLDETEIHGGTRWSDELQLAIQTADAFLFLVSSHSVASKECGGELMYALELNKRILPIRVGETPISGLPEGLGAYQFIPSREPFAEHFDASLQALITEIETDRDWVREHTRWSETAVQWDHHNRDRAYLLSGSELESAEAWRSRAAGKRPGLNSLQNELIDASRRNTTSRLRRTRSAVSVALAVAIGLSVVAFILRQQAVTEGQVAKSGELSAQSLLQLGTDPQLSLLLAADAARFSETPSALDALRSAIPENHLIRTFSADSAPIENARWSPDGRFVATASQDGYVRVYNAATGALLRRFPVSTYDSGGVAFIGGGRELASWVGGSVHLWSLATGASIRTFSDPSFYQLNDVQFNPRRPEMATASGPGSAGASELWNLATGVRLAVLTDNGTPAHGALPQSLHFSPDGRLIAGGSENGTATVWSTRTGAVLRQLRLEPPSLNGREPYVFGVAFSRDGSRLLTTQQDSAGNGRTVVWRVSDWSTITVPGLSAAWSPDGRQIATVQASGTAQIFDGFTGQAVSPILKAPVPLAGVPLFVALGGGQSDLVVGSRSGQTFVFSAASGAVTATLAGDSGAVVPESASADGAEVLTSSTDGSARIWETGQVAVQPARVPRLVGLRPETAPAAGSPMSTGYDQSGDLLAPLRAVPTATQLLIEDIRTGAVTARIPNDGRSFGAVAIDQLGRLALLASTRRSNNVNDSVVIVRAHGGAVVRTLSGTGSSAVSCVLSPDGGLAATVDAHGDVATWDTATGRRLALFTRNAGSTSASLPVVDVRFSPDGRLLLSADLRGRTFVWNPRTGGVLEAIQGNAVPQGQYLGMGGAISPNDRLVVMTRSWEDTASVYRLGHARPLLTLRGAGDGIEDSAFSPDGTLIAMTSADDTIRVWDTQHSSPLETIPRPTTPLQVRFSPDGRSLITDPQFNSSALYDTLSCVVCGGFRRLLGLAQQRETRSLTPQERAQFQIN